MLLRFLLPDHVSNPSDWTGSRAEKRLETRSKARKGKLLSSHAPSVFDIRGRDSLMLNLCAKKQSEERAELPH
jgi:hypothetical protein